MWLHCERKLWLQWNLQEGFNGKGVLDVGVNNVIDCNAADEHIGGST